MKNSHKVSNLISHLAKAKGAGSPHISASAKPPAAKDYKSESMSESVSHSLQFGSPSSRTARGAQSSSEWAKLLQRTAAGGLSNAIGGGGLLNILGGVGSLVSGITGLFGGGDASNAPPPLALFSLPISQSQAVPVNSKAQSGSAPSFGGAAQSPYSVGVAADHQEAYQVQSAQIAQAVKHALLNSSSLNDVIAEI